MSAGGGHGGSGAGCELAMDGPVARIRLNHPPLNILTLAMRRELLAHVAEIERNPAVRVVVVEAAAGASFSVGSDLREFPRDEAGGRQKIEAEQHLLDRIERLEAVTLARLTGHVLGGGAELMLATDLRLAAADAVFAFPEVKVGGFPAAGGVWRLARDVGPVRARELLLLGGTITAAEARGMGLVNACAPAGELDAKVRQWVQDLLALPQASLLAIKRIVAVAGAADVAARATDAYGSLFRGADMAEGIAAFLEKRAPRFNQAPARQPSAKAGGQPQPSAPERP